jgi:hypothetical protein
MKNFHWGVLILLGILLLSSCISIRTNVFPQKPEDPRTKEKKNFDPWKGEEKQEVVITKRALEEKLETSTSITQSFGFDNSASGGKINLEGLSYKARFRTQVFASIFPEEAYRKADSLRNIYPESVYVQFKYPYYKMRIGDFENRAEAEYFLEKLRQGGYTQA